MSLKLLNRNAKNFIQDGRKITRKFKFFELSKVCFGSEKKDDPEGEVKLRKLLMASSPLKPSPEAEQLWSTTSYVKGTVFHGSEVELPTEKKDPSETSIILFPGQGNQYVGMAKNVIKYPVAQDMFDAASQILGYNLLKLCQEGPEEKLNRTEYCQPATMVCSLAALEKLKDETPWAINNCTATCGYSLGEFSALVFAGCLSFEKAVSLVNIRAKAMESCCKMADSGMLTIVYGPKSDLKGAIKDSLEHCVLEGVKGAHCSIASYLAPYCRVVAGNIEALNYIIQNSTKYGFKRLSKLPVSGAFHTELMKDAALAFKEALKNVELRDPLIKVFSNLNGKCYFNASDIKKKLPKQIYSSVKWEQAMNYIYKRPKEVSFPYTYECGPGVSLTTLLKRISPIAADQCSAVKL